MRKVAAVLYLHVARSLSKFCLETPSGSTLEAQTDTQTGNSTKVHWSLLGASRVLGATFALLLMTACGGGWGSLGGQLPTITKQPENQTVATGQTATFTVAATGVGTLNYQWYKNGTAINGATSTSYTTPSATSTDSGSVFKVTVTNAAGTVTSNPATLTVTASSAIVNPHAPVITSQPVSQTIPVGQTATFNVAATGDPTLTYQWYKGGVAIVGATSSAYTTPTAVIGDNGSVFTVTVTNSAGSATSNPANLTVTTTASVPPTITTPPANQTVNVGQTATFNVVATGTAPLTYQWSDNGTPIPWSHVYHLHHPADRKRQ